MAPQRSERRGKRPMNKNVSRNVFDKNNKKKTRLRPGEFDLEKARQEVFMLGIKGFTHKDKQEAKRELAVRLGATPKKPRGKSIKKHMEEVREKKLKRQQDIRDREKFGREFEAANGKLQKSKTKPRKKSANKSRNK